jgi:hypothetical protein
MRVCAVKGMNVAPRRARRAAQIAAAWRAHDAAPFRRFVGQRGELRRVGQLRLGDAFAGRKATAWRLPSVMVPVLSSSSTSTSPAASTARPEVAITLACIMRLMPATPMADSSPPMVVGIRHTSSATSTVIVTGAPAGRLHAEERERQQRHRHQQEDDGQRHQQNGQRDSRWASSGVWRLRPSRSCGRGTSRRVDRDAHHEPVRQHARAAGDGEKSPPDSRITGADSPVMALSSTEATPSMTSPSAGSCRRPRPAPRRPCAGRSA